MAGDIHQWSTYAQFLITALSRYPDRVALIQDDRQVTYRQLAERISQVVQAFRSYGLGKNEALAQLSQNSIGAVIVQLAAYVLGPRFIPLHPLGSVDDHAYILRDAEVVALVYEPERFSEAAERLSAAVPGLGHVISHEPDRLGRSLFADAKAFGPAPLVPPDTGSDDIVTMLYTGGTTGKSKGVVLPNRSMVLNTLLCLADWEWPHDIRFLCATPITHASGCMIIPVLLRGGTIILQAGFQAERFLDAVAAHRVTATFLVPTMIYMLLDHPKMQSADLSSLELVIYGGSPASPTRVAEAVRRIGPVFMQIYSQSEAPNYATALRRAEHDPADLERLSSCGRPLAGITVRILDEADRPVPVGEVGEVCFRGPSIMQGYWKKPEETRETLRGGWLHTGDLARQDEHGFIYIVDRRKDMIVSGGFNVYPREVEDALTAHPEVAAAAVIGVPDEKWGEAVKAVVVKTKGSSIEAGELIRYVRQKKGPVAAPKSVDFVDALPLTALGKPDKKAIRARYWGERARQVN